MEQPASPTLDAFLRRRRRNRRLNVAGFVLLALVLTGAQDSSIAQVTPGPTPNLSAASERAAGQGRFLATTVRARQLSWLSSAWCALRPDCHTLPVDTSPGAIEGAIAQMQTATTTAATLARDVAGVHATRPAPTFDLGRIAGPSAGLMLTLATLDALTPGDLTGGQVIAGTGTISDSGAVGEVGGVQQKSAGARAAGAQLFLAPSGEADAARAAQPDLEVVAVDTLTDAVAALCRRGSDDAVCADHT